MVKTGSPAGNDALLFINDANLPIWSFQVVVQVIRHHGACSTGTEYNKVFIAVAILVRRCKIRPGV